MPDRRKPRPVLVTVVFLGLIAFAVFGIQLLDALLFNPWALSLTGAPTLTGPWTGELRLPGGETRQVHLVIVHTVERRCGNCDIGGSLRLCRGPSLEREYRILGDNDTWRGSAFHVDLTADGDYRTGELRLGRMDGEWSGDVVRITAPWWRHSRTATAEVRRGETPAPEPVLTFDLRRGGTPAC